MPNEPAPVWNTPRDISAVVTWKFIPNVETKKMRISVIHSCGRARTYCSASRNWPLARGARAARCSSSGRMSFRLISTAP
jgi:hypothetical protein